MCTPTFSAARGRAGSNAGRGGRGIGATVAGVGGGTRADRRAGARASFGGDLVSCSPSVGAREASGEQRAPGAALPLLASPAGILFCGHPSSRAARAAPARLVGFNRRLD